MVASKPSQVIRSRAPVRVDFAGGWTDVALFCQETPGAVVNAAFNSYSMATVLLKDRPTPEWGESLRLRRTLEEKAVEIYSSDFDVRVEAQRIADLELDGNADLVKAAIKRMDTQGGFSLITSSSAPPGSGLGTSASMGVALISALAYLSRRHFLGYQLAELASEIERVDLGIRGGKQDHYASAYGGVSFMEFHGEEVRCCPMALPRGTVLELEQNLVLAYTGKSRLSGDIHEKVTGAFRAGERGTVEAIEGMKRIAHEVKDALFEADLEKFAHLMLENWAAQKALHPSVSNDQIEEAFQAAMEAGAVGGKACGAGGGGCLLFYCRPDTKHRVRRALTELDIQLIDFLFDFCGVETWQA